MITLLTGRKTRISPRYPVLGDHPILNGISACWTFHEGGGIYVHDLAKQNMMKFFANPTGWVGTELGVLPKLKGTGSGGVADTVLKNLTAGSSSLAMPRGVSVSAWIYGFNANFSNGSDSHSTIFENWNNAGNGYSLGIATSSSDKIAYYSGAGGHIDPGTNTITTKKWHHICTSQSAAAVKAYIDGVLDSTVSTSVAATSAADSLIGSSAFYDSARRALPAIIGPVGVWARALSPAEVKILAEDPFVYTWRRHVWRFAGNPANISLTEFVNDTLSLSDNVGIQVFGGTALLETLIDTLSLVDHVDIRADCFIKPAETLSLSDSAAGVGDIQVVQSDTIALSDASSNFLIGILGQAITDTVAFSDAIGDSYGGKTEFLFTDFINLSDSVKRFAKYYLSVSDVLVLQDFIGNDFIWTAQVFTFIFGAGAIALFDEVQTVLNIAVQAGDTISLSDSIGGFEYKILVTDIINLLDSIVVSLLTSGLLLSDTLSLNDSVNINLTRSALSFSDTLTLSDSIRIHLVTDINSYLRQYLNDVPGITN